MGCALYFESLHNRPFHRRHRGSCGTNPPRPPLTKGQGSPPLRRPPWVTPSPFPVRFQPSGACSWASRVGSCTQAGSPRLTSPEDRGQAPSGGSDVIGRELRQGVREKREGGDLCF